MTEMAQMLDQLFPTHLHSVLLGKASLLDQLLDQETLNMVLKIMIVLIALVVVAVYAILFQKKTKAF